MGVGDPGARARSARALPRATQGGLCRLPRGRTPLVGPLDTGQLPALRPHEPCGRAHPRRLSGVRPRGGGLAARRRPARPPPASRARTCPPPPRPRARRTPRRGPSQPGADVLPSPRRCLFHSNLVRLSSLFCLAPVGSRSPGHRP